MTLQLDRTADVSPVAPALSRRQQRRAADAAEIDRGILSNSDRRRPTVRAALFSVQGLILIGLIIVGVGPILWLFKASLSQTQDIVSNPLGILFDWSDLQWGHLGEAWNKSAIGKYILNTLIIALGQAVITIFVCTTCAYCLSVLRPKWGSLLSGAIMATLFIPGIIALVPLYLTVIKLPIVGGSLIDNYFALWLPGAANAFMILIVRRFFDGLPRDLFEAAKLDGAGPFRVFTRVVLPLSRPIIGVVGLLAIIASWKDFLWPLLVLPSRTKQPISVALYANLNNTELSVVMGALFLALLVPVVLFVLFQKQFLRGVSASAGIKG